MPSGATATTPTVVGLGAGLIYIGTTLWGATRGGVRSATGQEMRSIEFDGRTGRILGHDRIVGWDPTIAFDIVEFSAAVLARINPGSTSVTVGGTTTITPRDANVLLVSGDYMTNFLAAWPRGDGTYFRIRFPKALVISYEGPNGTDKEEAVASVTVAAALDLAGVGATTDDAPFVLETGLVAPTTGV